MLSCELMLMECFLTGERKSYGHCTILLERTSSQIYVNVTVCNISNIVGIHLHKFDGSVYLGLFHPQKPVSIITEEDIVSRKFYLPATLDDFIQMVYNQQLVVLVHTQSEPHGELMGTLRMVPYA